MNMYLLIASCLTLILALAHSVLGELKIFKHLKDEGLPVVQGIPMMWKTDGFAKRTIRFVWHVTSIFGIGFASVLAYFSHLPSLSVTDIAVVKIIAGAMLLSGLVTVLLSKGSHLGWVLFFAVGVFCMLAVM